MKRVMAMLSVLAVLVSLTACMELPMFSAKNEAFSYKDLEAQLNRFAEEDGVEGVLSMDTIEYPRKLHSGALLYYVTYWDGLFSIYITEMEGQVVVIQSITDEVTYASRHAEKTREEWAAVAAYPFVLCEDGLRMDTVGKWHASMKEKEGYAWNDSLCTYESEEWTYSWTQNESTIFITANHESYTPGGETPTRSEEDATPLTHEVLIERLNGFADEIGMVGVGEVTSKPKDKAGEIGYNFRCFGELVDVEVIEKDGEAVQVMAITNSSTYPKEIAGVIGTQDFSLMAFILASSAPALCEMERDSDAVAAWMIEKFDQADVETTNGVEFRTYISDKWKYSWLTNDFGELGNIQTCVAVDIDWADANISAKGYATVSPTTPTTTSPTTAPTVFSPYTIRLDASTAVYSGPGFSNEYVGSVGQTTTYTIVEEIHNNSSKWGKLKSGLGWVCLDGVAEKDDKIYISVDYTTYLEEGTTIYSGPGYEYSPAETIAQSTNYTIVEECYNNARCWGKLKSGLGWVDLSGWGKY